MKEFDFTFTLVGLLLGFVLVELASGVARAVKAGRPNRKGEKPTFRIGWLTLLLLLFLLMDVTSLWTSIWWMRDGLPVKFDTVFGALAVTGLYYIAASLVFPDDLEAWPDLDEWFWLNKRSVLLCVAAASVLGMSAMAPIVLMAPDPPPLPALLGQMVIYLILVLVAALGRTKRVVASALAVLVVLYVSYAVLDLMERIGGIA